MFNMIVPRRMDTFMIDEKQIWSIYSDKLYKWINEKYEEYLNHKISEERYFEYLQFYETEIQLLAVVINGDKILLQLPEVKDLQQQLLSADVEKEGFDLIEKRFQELFGPTDHQKTKMETIGQINKKEEQAVQTNTTQAKTTMKKSFSLPSETKRRIENAIKSMNHARQLRIAIVGSEASGKTEIRFAIEDKKQPLRHHKGGGAAISVAKFQLSDGEKIKISLIELEHGKAQRITRIGFYKSSDIILIVLDSTNEEEMFKLQEWLNEIISAHISSPIIIAINKIDVKKHRIKTKQVESLIKKFRKTNPEFKNNIKIFETSATKKKGIKQLREYILSYGHNN